MVQRITSLSDLPEEAMRAILMLLCPLESGGSFRDYLGVCRSWRDIFLARLKGVRMLQDEGMDASTALRQLRGFSCVRRVTVGRILHNHREYGRLLRGLASSHLPPITYLSLTFYRAQETLQDTVYLVSRLTRLRELKLTYDDRRFPLSHGSSDGPGHATGHEGELLFEHEFPELYPGVLQAIDFGSLAELELLHLDYQYIALPGGALGGSRGSFNETFGRLEKLRVLTLTINAALPLPRCLWELTNLEKLVLGGFFHNHPRTAYLDGPFERFAALRHVELACNSLVEEEVVALTRIPALTGLGLTYEAAEFPDGINRLLFSSLLRKLTLSSYAGLPVLREALPKLEELTLTLLRQGQMFQRNLFAYTPNLRSLMLTLYDGCTYPALSFLKNLTSLELATPEGYCNLVHDRGLPTVSIRGLPALERLKLHDCSLLSSAEGIDNLEKPTSVTLVCLCDNRCPGGRLITSYSQCIGQHRCNVLMPDLCKRLFHNTLHDDHDKDDGNVGED